MIFTSQDLMIVGLLIFLEGILSIDNALVLALLVRHLPKDQQKKALSYGLVGALVFRAASIAMASFLIRWRWVKFVGGTYLLWVAFSHFFRKSEEAGGKKRPPAGFWKTVVVIELTDIAFAVDSILAAVALTPKYALVLTGGVIGLVMMRFAATLFLGLLERFPGLETTAYLLIVVIGVKIMIEGLQIEGFDFHSPANPAFWVFWGLMGACVAYGFLAQRKGKSHS